MKHLLALVLFLSACAAERDHAQPLPAVERDLDPAARWVEQVAEAQELANRAATGADRISTVERLATLALVHAPSPVSVADDAATRLDLFGRAAQLALDSAEPQRALDLAGQGLRLDASDGPFRRQLFIVTARAKQALGDSAGAADAVRAARGVAK